MEAQSRLSLAPDRRCRCFNAASESFRNPASVRLCCDTLVDILASFSKVQTALKFCLRYSSSSSLACIIHRHPRSFAQVHAAQLDHFSFRYECPFTRICINMQASRTGTPGDPAQKLTSSISARSDSRFSDMSSTLASPDGDWFMARPDHVYFGIYHA